MSRASRHFALLGLALSTVAGCTHDHFASPASDGSGGAIGTGGARPTSPLPPGDPGTVVSEPTDDASYVFDEAAVRTYSLTVDPGDLAFIDGNPAAEDYVLATLQVDGETYEKVGLRYKGSYGAFLPPCTATSFFATTPSGPKTEKCSMKLSFDYAKDDGRFHGLRKLNLHAMNRDPSLMRERLGYGMFREFGVPSPRAVHARVVINGKVEGLFVAVEQIDDRFTASRFTEGGSGNLYKEVWPMFDDEATYLDALESKKTSSTTAAHMVALNAAVGAGTDAVERLIDRDYTVRYMAADRVIMNDDGAFHWWCTVGGQGSNPGGLGNHNYYWYEAASAERLWILPWDLDSSLGAPFVLVQPEWRTTADCVCSGYPPQRPTSCDPLFALWATWRDDYEAAVDAFLAGPFDVNRVEEKLQRYSAQIASAVAESTSVGGAESVEAWQSSMESLRSAMAACRTGRGYPYPH